PEAALERVTVQVDEPPEARVEGEQASEVSDAGGLMTVVAEGRKTLRGVAAIVDEPSNISAAAGADKSEEGRALDTEREAGTVRLALSSDADTTVLLEAALDRVTVQVDEAPEARVEGEQASEVSDAGTLRAIVAVRETPLSVAVTIAELSAEKLPALAVN